MSGWRGNLDEGEPHGLPGSYLNGVYELHPLPYAEAGYGYPESGQTVINVTNGKIIRLLVDDEPFDLRYGELHAHERVLDFRARHCLSRTCEWTSPSRPGGTRQLDPAGLLHPAGHRRRLLRGRSRRRPVRVVVQSELVANERLPRAGGDPRAAAALDSPLVAEEHFARGHARCAWCTGPPAADCGWRPPPTTSSTVRTARRGQRSADRMSAGSPSPHRSRPGRRLRLEKFVAYGWSGQRSLPALRDQVDAALAGGPQHRLGGSAHRAARLPRRLLVPRRRRGRRRRGDPAGGPLRALPRPAGRRPRASSGAIPAKGLTGSGYDGHSFWDTETFVLPVLTYTAPQAVADGAALAALARCPRPGTGPRQLGLQGAAFPWRTIDGEECSGYWPAGTAAFHVNADIADAVVRYVAATGDEDFEREMRARAPGGDRPAVAVARPPRHRRPSSTSTGSPAPTSTARSPTTTSTPT